MADSIWQPQTMQTSLSRQAHQTPNPLIAGGLQWGSDSGRIDGHNDLTMSAPEMGSTGKGILIGIMSAFGSAGLIALVVAIIYFFRFTPRGRVFLDRLGRPGEYDDEQAFLREEEEALEAMDDSQRQEYLRAKGNFHTISRKCTTNHPVSVCTSEPSRIITNRHFLVTVPRHPGKGCLGMGVRARVGNCQLLCRAANGNRILRLGMLRAD